MDVICYEAQQITSLIAWNNQAIEAWNAQAQLQGASEMQACSLLFMLLS